MVFSGLGGPKSWAAGPSECSGCMDAGAAVLAVPAVGTATVAGVLVELRLEPGGCWLPGSEVAEAVKAGAEGTSAGLTERNGCDARGGTGPAGSMY